MKLLAFSAALLCVVPAALAQFPTNGSPFHQIRFSAEAEANTRRQTLRDFIWDGPLPATLPEVEEDVALPIYLGSPSQAIPFDVDPLLYSRIDTLKAWVTDFDYFSNALLLHPSVLNENTNQLVIVHKGHSSWDAGLEGGIRDAAETLLAAGYTVALHQMPGGGWNHPAWGDVDADIPGYGPIDYPSFPADFHDAIIEETGPPGGGWGFRLFLEPVLQTVNHWVQLPGSEGVSIIGYSGGGWTAHMLAALDVRIWLSIPVAGAAPLYVRNVLPGSAGDREQHYTPLFDEDIQSDGSGGGVATWLEIFALGGHGPERRQIMVTNELEPCCFGGIFPDGFKEIVSDRVASLDWGRWEHIYDDTQPLHIISPHTIDVILMGALASGPSVRVPSASYRMRALLGLGLLAACGVRLRSIQAAG